MTSKHLGLTTAHQPRKPHSAIVAARAALGLLLTFVGAVWIGIAGSELGRVWYTQKIVDPTTAPTLPWIVCTAATALGLTLLTAPRAWITPVDWLQLLGGCWTIGWVYLFSDVRSQAEFTGSQPPCTYTSCWPQGYQETATAIPIVIAVIAMILTSTLGRQLRWSQRATVPSTTFVILTIAQLVAWDRLLIPFLNAPPPW